MDLRSPKRGVVLAAGGHHWEEALISGNGRQGALCYGDASQWRVTLSHERLFLPLCPPLEPPGTVEILPELRQLLLSGHYQQAAERVCAFAAAEQPGYRDLRWVDPFIGAATLTYTPESPGSDYHRAVDFSTGVVSQWWRTRSGEISTTLFVSRPDDVVVARLTGPLDGVIHLGPIEGTPQAPLSIATAAAPDHLILRGWFPRRWPRACPGYAVVCRVIAPADTVQVDGVRLLLRGAREVILLLRTVVAEPTTAPTALADSAASDPAAAVTSDLSAAVLTALRAFPSDVDRLLATHTAVHCELFERCTLSLTSATHEVPDADSSASPSPQAAPVTPGLIERLFDAGRYAIISACGSLPPTLQGVWSGTHQPAWSGAYTIDGNLQAAVAGLLPTRTPELMLSVFDLFDALLDDFRVNARRLYGARGILTPVHIASHGYQNHFGPVWCQTFWTAGAAWLARLYYDYWHYTGDRDFLATRAWPFMTAAADFYTDFLAWSVESDPVIFAPSYSPENAPASSGSQACVNATMDVAAVSDLLRNLLVAAQVLKVEDPRIPQWRALLARMPAYRITPEGALAEWIWPQLTENPAHRHASHLYPLWYELDPAFVADPALRSAAEQAIRHRLEFWRSADADEMAYGLVQLGIAAAHLGLAELAYEALTRLTRYWRDTLVSTHNLDAIFNVDISGGLPALVLAMLVRSGAAYPLPDPYPEPGLAPIPRLDLLPALPTAWPQGEVRGVAARGQVTVRRLTWSPTRVEAVIDPGPNAELVIGAPPGTRPVPPVEPQDATLHPDGSLTLRPTPGQPVTLRFEPSGKPTPA